MFHKKKYICKNFKESLVHKLSFLHTMHLLSNSNRVFFCETSPSFFVSLKRELLSGRPTYARLRTIFYFYIPNLLSAINRNDKDKGGQQYVFTGRSSIKAVILCSDQRRCCFSRSAGHRLSASSFLFTVADFTAGSIDPFTEKENR